MFRKICLFGFAVGASSLVTPASAQNFGLELPSFNEPLQSESPVIDGRSISGLVTGYPLFAPFEGLPDSAWKGRTCSGCHQWTQQDLCRQGNTYADNIPSKLHPYGGPFKEFLQLWAITGCE